MAESKKRKASNRKVRRPAGAIRLRSRRGPSRGGRVFVVAVGVALAAGAVFLVSRGIGRIKGILFTDNPRFAVSDIAVEGAAGLTPDEVVARCGVGLGDNLPAVDLHLVRRRLEAVPNIESAEVRREMPGRLCLRIRERWPVARLESGELLAADGVVLDPGPFRNSAERRALAANLPVIAGVPGHPFRPGEQLDPEWYQAAVDVLRYARERSGEPRIRIECIDAAARHGLTLYLEGGRTVPMDRDGIDRQLRRLSVILEETERMGRDVATVDLTSGRSVPATFRN